jgi:hypothetical protein
MRKSETRYWIERKGRQKFADTSIEMTLERLALWCGCPSKRQEVKCSGGIILRVDRMVRGDVALEALGEYHFTQKQESKTRWRCDLLKGAGKRPILIGFMYLVPKWELFTLGWLWHAIRDPAFGVDQKLHVQALVS